MLHQSMPMLRLAAGSQMKPSEAILASSGPRSGLPPLTMIGRIGSQPGLVESTRPVGQVAGSTSVAPVKMASEMPLYSWLKVGTRKPVL